MIKYGLLLCNFCNKIVCRLNWDKEVKNPREDNWSTVANDYRRALNINENFAHTRCHGILAEQMCCDHYSVYDYESKKLFPMWYGFNCHLKFASISKGNVMKSKNHLDLTIL